MSTPPKIAVSAMGAPLLPGTWSGTPANICRELSRLESLGSAIDSEQYAPGFIRLGAKVLGKLFYRGSPYLRLGRLERSLRARRVAHYISREGIANLLHMGTLDLPSYAGATDPANTRCRHFLLTDTTWDLWSRYSTDQHRVSRRLTRNIKSLDKEAYDALSHIFVIGQYVKQNLVEHYHLASDKITVVGSGRGAIKPFEGQKNYTNANILFVAKERFRDKGGEALIAGFRLARRSNPKLSLSIVGSDGYRSLADATENISTYGRLPLPELQRLFDDANLYAMPARNEPWGLVYLEALACKVPILGLRRLSLPEITCNGRYGFCLDTAEPAEIAEALLQAFSDPARLEAMSEGGHRYCVENFTWERTVGRILDVISALTDGVKEKPGSAPEIFTHPSTRP